jgi:tetratricopeptide (TPR) repeat protein
MTDLAQSLLSEELRSLQRRQWTGVLSLSSGEVTKGLFMRDGHIVFAASTLEEDKLGETLVRAGRISRDQLDAAHRSAQAASRRLGLALVGAGAVSTEELIAAVSAQVERIVLSVLQWTEGAVMFQDTERPIADELALDLSTHRLLLEGARAFPDIERLQQALGDVTRRLRRADEPPFDYDSMPAVPVERAILAAVPPQRRIADLLALAAPQADLIRGVYSLLVGGMLQEVDPPPVRRDLSRIVATISTLEEGEPEPLDESVDPAERARVHLQRGDRRKAIALLQEVVARNPADAYSQRLLAIAMENEPRYSPETERQFLKALEIQPKDLDLRYRLAAYYRRVGMPARAILQLKIVLGRDPHHAPAWRDLAELEKASGKPRRSH